jgi:hypothetical protein
MCAVPQWRWRSLRLIANKHWFDVQWVTKKHLVYAHSLSHLGVFVITEVEKHDAFAICLSVICNFD